MHDRKISPWWYWSKRFLRASPFTSAWHYCWPTPSASSSGSASDLRPLSLFRFLDNFIKSNAPVKTYIDILPTTYFLFHFISPERPHECGDVCSHPPLRVHQQQGGCSTWFSSKPSVSWPSNVLWQKIGGSTGLVKVVESHSEVLLAVYPRVLFLPSLCCPLLKEWTNYSHNKIIWSISSAGINSVALYPVIPSLHEKCTLQFLLFPGSCRHRTVGPVVN